MIDICSFLNSRDVSAHLRKIGYEFTAPEAAFVVYWSDNATLDEKIVAWREIVETMADCSMEEHGCRKSAPSFHRFLLDFIDLQKRKVEQFFDSRGCVYSYSYFEGGFQDDGNVFSNVEDCIAYIKEDWSQDCWNEDDVPSKFRIRALSISLNLADTASYISTVRWRWSMPTPLALRAVKPMTTLTFGLKPCGSHFQRHSSEET